MQKTARAGEVDSLDEAKPVFNAADYSLTARVHSFLATTAFEETVSVAERALSASHKVDIAELTKLRCTLSIIVYVVALCSVSTSQEDCIYIKNQGGRFSRPLV